MSNPFTASPKSLTASPRSLTPRNSNDSLSGQQQQQQGKQAPQVPAPRRSNTGGQGNTRNPFMTPTRPAPPPPRRRGTSGSLGNTTTTKPSIPAVPPKAPTRTATSSIAVNPFIRTGTGDIPEVPNPFADNASAARDSSPAKAGKASGGPANAFPPVVSKKNSNASLRGTKLAPQITGSSNYSDASARQMYAQVQNEIARDK